MSNWINKQQLSQQVEVHIISPMIYTLYFHDIKIYNFCDSLSEIIYVNIIMRKQINRKWYFQNHLFFDSISISFSLTHLHSVIFRLHIYFWVDFFIMFLILYCSLLRASLSFCLFIAGFASMIDCVGYICNFFHMVLGCSL